MHKLLPWIAALFCVIAILVDFTSKFLSIVVDGSLLAIVIGIIFMITRTKEEKGNGKS